MADALGAVAGESAGALAVVGEPGIGKTRLLAELGALADGCGQRVLSGRAAEFERDLPFGVFVDALDEHLRALDPHKIRRLGSELAGELAQVFPALSGLAVNSGSVLQDERYRAHRAVRELLERLSAGRPLVLVLDDLHWADQASIELLSALLRRPPNAAVLLAVSLRPRQADAGLASVLEHAYREGRLERLELCPLSQREAEQLLPASLRPDVRAALYVQAGGNPFYLEELARSLGRAVRVTASAEHNADSAASEDAGVPPAVAVALAQELRLLEVSTRLLLEGAAVTGDQFDLELAAAVAEVPAADMLEALDELLECDLVRPTDLPRSFRFRHPLVRRAVYEAAPGGWRLGAHERAAKALAARGAGAGARAHHVEQSARVGDLDAIALLSQAGGAAAQRAPASAARWFEAAVRLLPDERVGQRIELLIALATSLAAAGRLQDSRSSLLLLLELVPDEAGAVRVKVIVRCATLENMLGRHSDARDRLRSALDELSDRSSPEAIALMIQVAVDGFYSADYGRMRNWAKQALDGARPLGERPVVAAATAIVAFACACAGDVAEGQRHADEAARLVDALSDAELARRLDASPALAWAEYSLERYEDSIGHSERGIAVARATGRGEYMQEMLRAHAASSMLLGRVAEAIDSAERAVDAARLAGNRQSLIRALTHHAGALIDRDAKSALHAAEESVVLMRELEHNAFFAVARAMFATVVGEFGEAARCANELLEAGGGPQLGLIPATWRVFYCEVLTRAELARGRLREADQAARHAQVLADSLGLHLATTWAQRARAEVLLAEDKPLDAAELALASAAGAAAVGARVEAARSRKLAGRALRSAGERQRAVAELQAAATAFESCGALRLRDEVERELRRLGQRFNRRREPGDAGVGALSARELEIAELVTERQTNREIAAELFLSEKTIETHLRNIFGKLGVSSRRAVAHALETIRAQAAVDASS